ncbi:protein SUPPRESSOR OF MAX2 1 [Pyrus x bretschneideri]|uniref:protein SUPPRESSOR OF MAX2 1 n=1 Tax=Pyrus x bretschneideri TaxID=225117 RepID=UPI00202F4223|nr:protein SUPPRESSOR OF MAX2 1 [Pyrus x bretschneideri]
MRAGLSTIQQTLTPEAASVLNHSIAEAGRRNHGQTTPLHVAATLLSSPTGFLRQACIKSHPNSSHPLQCRALELCFSVALERLPTAQNMSPGMEPPISNALMAALKRAQAHQRRGCPEQQQQPLLAVKVELEQLIISILDDPSVSRVMREASFSSPAVKATIEQTLNSSAAAAAHAAVNSSPIGLQFRPAGPTVPPVSRNLYLNPRLQQPQGAATQSGQHRGEEVKRVADILLRTKKRNPVLVGDSEPEAMTKELLRRIQSKELGEGPLKNVDVLHLEEVVSLDRNQIVSKMKELGGLIETRLLNLTGGGVILDLGDLKWLVEQPASFGGVPGPGLVSSPVQQQVVSEAGRAAVGEMGKLLARYGEGSATGGRLWLIGTATCETYLRCQVYHPSMETDWDLQAVPIAGRTPLSGLFPRIGATNGILSSSVESLSPMKGFPSTSIPQPRLLSENSDPARRETCCPQCTESYEQELAKLVAKESGKSSSESEAAQPPLPQWLQNAKPRDVHASTLDQTKTTEQNLILKQKTNELQKEWRDTCLHLHPNFHQPSFSSKRIIPTTLSMTSLYNPNLLGRQPFQTRSHVNKNLGTLQLSTNPLTSQPSERAISQPESPVRTELVLGQTEVTEFTSEQMHKERIRDFMGCMPSEPQNKLHEMQTEDKQLCQIDTDSFKKLYKGLMEVWWQQEAAASVAETVTQCKLGNGKRHRAGSRGDMWLLFMGLDSVGKKKMASALSELVCGSNPVMIGLSSQRGNLQSDMSFRGKTVVDRIAETVKRNPFSVVVLEDINEADLIVRGSIKRAIERGRLADSYGREISLGNVIFILTANWLPENLGPLSNDNSLEEKLASIARSSWQLKLSVCARAAKRRANWLTDEDRATKPRTDTGSALGFDLNEAADAEGDRTDGSLNSSDLTVDNEDDNRLNNRTLLKVTTTSVPQELLDSVDDAIVFKPVDFNPIRQNITNSIRKRFSKIMGEGISFELPEDAVEKILTGIWLGRTGLEEWAEKVLAPSIQQLKSYLGGSTGVIADESLVVRLESDGASDDRSRGDRLPSSINVGVVPDGLRQK